MADEKLTKMEFEVGVKNLDRVAIAQATAHLEGSEVGNGPWDRASATLDLVMLPHVAGKIPLGSRWRMTLERVGDE